GSKRARAKPIGIADKNDAEKWVRRSTGSCEQGNNKPEQARDAGGRGRDEPCTSSSKLASLADRLQTRCRSAATARGRPRRTVANACRSLLIPCPRRLSGGGWGKSLQIVADSAVPSRLPRSWTPPGAAATSRNHQARRYS